MNLFYFLLIILFVSSAYSQNQVIVRLTQPPPNKLGIAELWSLELVNTTGREIRAYAVGTVSEARDGLILEATSKLFTIKPGRNVYTYRDFPNADVRYHNSRYRDIILRTGNAPSGDYTICISIRSETGDELGSDCIHQRVEIVSPPTPVFPADGDTLYEEQSPTFTWTPPTPVPQEVTYHLRIVEILGDQPPLEAMRQNPAWFEQKDIRTTSLQYPAQARKLESGKKYAWRVSALIAGESVESEVFHFVVARRRVVRPIDQAPSPRVVRPIEQAPIPSIQLLSPTEERPPTSNRPTFEWKMEPPVEGVTYTITVRELKEDVDIEAGKILFERSGIRETVFRYPPEIPPLDSFKVYSWVVSAYDRNNALIAQSNPAFFALIPPPPFCWWQFAWPVPYMIPVPKVCVGDPIGIHIVVIGGSGPITWSYSCNGPSGLCGSGSGTGSWIALPPPSSPGVYTYTVSWQRSGCPPKTQTITFYVYPNLTAQVLDYPSGTPITDLCWGDDATLNMVGLPPGCQVTWEYSTNGGITWNSLGQGNPFNTNPISGSNPLFSGLSCTGPSITLQFRGTVTNCLNLPSPWPPGCPNVKTTSLTVWCPSQAGNITASSTSGHTIQPGNKICSDKNGDGTPDYPINLTLTLNNYIGTITGWSCVSANMPTANYTINNAGTYTCAVTVQNGNCSPASTQITIIVEDPIQGNIQITQNGVPTNSPEVCWGDDKVTMTFIPTSPLPPGTILKWEYQINCSGPWIPSGVTGTTQNANDLILTPFYPPVNPCLVDKVCWRVVAQSATGTCPANIIGPVTINVVKPFDKNNPPYITPPSPSVKCPGQPVTLTVTNYTNCATGPFSFQWYLNGLPIPGATSASLNAVDPGNYTVVVYNKNKCDSIETKPVTVRDCSTKVVIEGPCTCSPGTMITLIASASSFVVPPGPKPKQCGPPYTYLWSTGATTPSITIPCPSQTTTYWVEVTNAMGCKVKAFHKVKVCK
jgi:hypothetical protein